MKPWDKKLNSFIKVNRVETQKSRKEKREEMQNTKYPYIISYEVVCSSWDSTELINDVKSILGEINRTIKGN
jgi:nucleoside diphosphate kinase